MGRRHETKRDRRIRDFRRAVARAEAIVKIRCDPAAHRGIWRFFIPWEEVFRQRRRAARRLAGNRKPRSCRYCCCWPVDPREYRAALNARDQLTEIGLDTAFPGLARWRPHE